MGNVISDGLLIESGRMTVGQQVIIMESFYLNVFLIIVSMGSGVKCVFLYIKKTTYCN